MKNLKYIKLNELVASVKDDLPLIKDSAFIDEGRVIKTVMWCNEKLGIPIRKVRETVLFVKNYKADFPSNFDKLIYVAALKSTGFGISQYRDPFDNFVDQVNPENIEMAPFTEGCDTNCIRSIKRKNKEGMWYEYTHWKELSLSKQSYVNTDSSCINRKINGEYIINVESDCVTTPFREGELYVMYYSTMEDGDGNLLVPFHPLITNWYEACIKEKILVDMVMNTDADVVNKLKLIQLEKSKAWLDAWNFTLEPEYRELQQYEKKKELDMWYKYYRFLV